MGEIALNASKSVKNYSKTLYLGLFPKISKNPNFPGQPPSFAPLIFFLINLRSGRRQAWLNFEANGIYSRMAKLKESP